MKRKPGTVSAFVAEAASQVGYKEGPNNATKYGVAAGANNQPWCGSFVDWCAEKSRTPLPGSMVYTPSGADAFQRAHRWHHTPKRGDVVFFDFAPGTGPIEHVGIVTSTRNWPTSVETIEGNTWSGVGVYQGEGDGVYRRTRFPGDIVGFGRPAFVKPRVLGTLRNSIAALTTQIAALRKRLSRKQRHLTDLTK